MKRQFGLLILTVLFSSSVLGQGLYFRAGSGYGLPVARMQIGEKYLYTSVSDGNLFTEKYSTEVVTASYGAGVNFNFALGYKFNENFIFDLNLQYLAGQKFETSNIYESSDIGFEGFDRDITKSSSSGLYINPTFIFSAGFGKRAPYGRFGVMLASPKITEEHNREYNIEGVGTSQVTWEYTNGIAVGFQTAVGINWEISERLDIYTELDFVSMNYYARNGYMVKNVFNDQDMLNQMSPYDKEIIYKKKYDPSVYDPTEPRIAPREASPFSCISVQAGIRFTLWKPGE